MLIVDRDEEAASETLRLAAAEGEAELFVGDMTDESDAERMVQRAVDLWGRVDALDNNIGVQQLGTVATASWDDWDRAISLNLKSTVLASKYALRAMVTNGGGSIINISSISGARPFGNNAPYAVTKGAVVPLTKSMAIDHGPQGVRVNCVVPGLIYTPMAVAEGVDARRSDRVSATAIKREGDGWDVGYAALFLASDESRFITGAVIPVDGGITVRAPDR